MSTKSEVLRKRQDSVMGGCCERFANNQACDCLETAEDDPINPSHYKQGGIECIDAIQAALTPEEFRGYCKGNAIKYTWRERHKKGVEDVKKAQWYLNRLASLKEIPDRDSDKDAELQRLRDCLKQAFERIGAQSELLSKRAEKKEEAGGKSSAGS